MQLVIVESPTKGKTIEKFLGPEFKVVSSYGHFRDLPKSKLGVDIEKNFEPQYIINIKSKKNINLVKKEAEKAESVILATDEDREGEAIAYHLAWFLNLLKNDGYKRIVFHEITKSAIREALETPRKIDINLVNAQQARRILDRLVGYKLSPFLWKKVARGLSAGRVQSVALRLIAEREKEIENFIPREYWQIKSLLEKDKKEFEAILIKKDGKNIGKLEIKNEKEAKKIEKDLEGAKYEVVSAEKKEIKKNPLPPFTTSTLQQEAWKNFRFTAKATMQIAQNLYERGFVTYHRTDSFNLSQQSLFEAKKYIEKNIGKEYWAGYFRKYKTKSKGAQEAHEAIRPTRIEKTAELEERQKKLYGLIWKRFVSCQMKEASFLAVSADIKAENYTFRANGQSLKFDGFLRIYPLKFEEKELPELEKGGSLNLIKLNSLQSFTKPPARYSEASLIKKLEAEGIGRPSTYAPILSNIQDKNYIEKNEERKFIPTRIGTVINDLLTNHFPRIVDIKFTAEMEENLDKVAQGKEKWTKLIEEFYQPFEENLEKKYEEISKKDLTEKPTEKKCPKCGSPLLVRLGKFGEFYACSAFPKCRHTEPLEKNTLRIKCPKCKKGNVLLKRTKRNKSFYGCDRYPDCDFASWDKPTGDLCPKCQSPLIETKKGQVKCPNKECGYLIEN